MKPNSARALKLEVASAAVAEAWAYSQQRVQGGKHICGHQAVRHVLSDVQTKLQACRLMLRHAAWLVETRQPSAVFMIDVSQAVSIGRYHRQATWP